jgi:farnesyl-diphosphate farnesyltransferase
MNCAEKPTSDLKSSLQSDSLDGVERIDREMLKRVSRSFYLSLRLLPGPMRAPISLGYLLARASDTLADTESVPASERIALLDAFAAELVGDPGEWRAQGLAGFISRQSHQGEKVLLERLGDCFEALRSAPPAEAEAIRDVVTTIISGQRLDLLRFSDATRESPASLQNDAELEDYCYRVAGCVGAFWTRVGFLTLGSRYSHENPEHLNEAGINYGKGLQLVNILRDYPEDLANGRCYVPRGADANAEAVHRRWLATAKTWLDDGKYYSSRLKSRRLRVATVLPALVGEETIGLLEAHELPPQAKRKVPRSVVRRALWEAFWWPAQV